MPDSHPTLLHLGGVADCPCCAEHVMVSDWRKPELCEPCQEAGCSEDPEVLAPGDSCPSYADLPLCLHCERRAVTPESLASDREDGAYCEVRAEAQGHGREGGAK